MVTIQDKLNSDTRAYALYKEEMDKLANRINLNARELLKELQEIEGWECMIKTCKNLYERSPKNFFDMCRVEHTDDAVQFIKDYSDGDEYEVLEISFRKPLKDQVRDRMEYLENLRHQREMAERESDMALLEYIKAKYNL